MIKAAVLGYGTVGSGVVQVLTENHDTIKRKAGTDIEVKYILDLRDFPGDPHQDKVVHDFNVILEDPEVAVVCETMGGNEPAFTFSMKALSAGKSVVTSNKELVANHGPELMKCAAEHSCSYLFEASVGGGIPIIRPINECLMQEDILQINGILNGTTNYILTKMSEEGIDFATCLKDAQEKGYAERKPEADVEGYDACRKIAILASLMSGETVHYEDIYTEGITKITAEDISYAKACGRKIKLIAHAQMEDGVCTAMVAPFMVEASNPLFAVSDVFNGILVSGNMLGDAMFYGRGAGKLATASAVVSDVIECAKNIGQTLPCQWREGDIVLGSTDAVARRFFLRVKDSSLEAAQKAFAGAEVINAGIIGEKGLITSVITEKDFADKTAEIEGFISRIRIED